MSYVEILEENGIRPTELRYATESMRSAGVGVDTTEAHVRLAEACDAEYDETSIRSCAEEFRKISRRDQAYSSFVKAETTGGIVLTPAKLREIEAESAVVTAQINERARPFTQGEFAAMAHVYSFENVCARMAEADDAKDALYRKRVEEQIKRARREDEVVDINDKGVTVRGTFAIREWAAEKAEEVD